MTGRNHQFKQGMDSHIASLIMGGATPSEATAFVHQAIRDELASRRRRECLLQFAWGAILTIVALAISSAVAMAEPLDLNYLAAVDSAVSHDRALIVFVGAPSQNLGFDCEAVGVESLPGYSAGDIVVTAPEKGKLWWVATYRDTKAVKVPTKPYFGGAIDALDEVNRQRAARGLPPFQRDDGLTAAAKAAATHRAANRIEGHTSNDFAFLNGASASSAGCACWGIGEGFGSCCIYEGYTYCGAAAVESGGRRWMHVFVR
jgi:Cysteine-rich secretory protein family